MHKDDILDPPNPLYCIIDNKSIYTKRRPYIVYGPMFMPTPGTFEKVLMDLIRPNMSKNVVKNTNK